jgi:hypothetical protein
MLAPRAEQREPTITFSSIAKGCPFGLSAAGFERGAWSVAESTIQEDQMGDRMRKFTSLG